MKSGKCLPKSTEANYTTVFPVMMRIMILNKRHLKAEQIFSLIFMPTDDEDEVPSTSVSRESPPCSECDKQKKCRKSVTDCKKCSKCQLKESNNENINDLDLEEVLNETMENETMETNNIMPIDKESTEKPGK